MNDADEKALHLALYSAVVAIRGGHTEAELRTAYDTATDAVEYYQERGRRKQAAGEAWDAIPETMAAWTQIVGERLADEDDKAQETHSEADFLDETIAKRTAANPDFPAKVEDARAQAMRDRMAAVRAAKAKK